MNPSMALLSTMRPTRFLGPTTRWKILRHMSVSGAPGTTESEPLHSNKQFQPNIMSAWQLRSFGGLKELNLYTHTKIPPITKPDEVLIKVSASSVNPIDIAMLGGYGKTVLKGLRAIEELCRSHLGPTLEFPLIPGRDFAGEVVTCGFDVKGLKPGDQVWGAVPPHHQGAHTEFVLAPSCTVCKRPENLTPTSAASLPYAALTAWSALWLSAGLCILPARGIRVLVIGGSGGVGTAAIQMLKAWGAQVTTTCRTDAVPMLESLGADVAIDYTQPDLEKNLGGEGPYDIILNASGQVGTPHLNHLKEWKMARYVILSPPLLRNYDELGLIGGSLKNGLDLLLPNIEAIAKRGVTVHWAFFVPSQRGLEMITQLAREEKLVPVIDSTFDFSDLIAAYQRLKDGHVRGKIVVRVEKENELESTKSSDT